jgi:hypothetical protein
VPITIALLVQIALKMNYQQYKEHLRKTMENAIAHLDVRELVEMELQNDISKPTKLIGEFKEESDYENIIK